MFPRGFAQTQAQRRCRPDSNALFWLLIGIVGLVFYACVPATTMVTSPENTIFRSKDYIVYQLQKTEAPADLALKFLGDKNKSWMIEEANPGVSFGNGNTIVIPLKSHNKGGLSSDGYQTIPILTYHRFAKSCSSPLCMPENIFDFQMRYLKENGYHAITGDQLLAFLEYHQGIPQKSVLITMDDGYRSVYDIAYPILKKYGFTATIFIYTSFVEVSKTAITWNQLKQMKAAGFTIGSHTIDHSDLTNPKEGESEQAFIDRIKRELYGSKKIIDQKLEQNTYFLAYPYGYYDQKSVQIAKKAGYKVAMSVKRGGNPFFANPLTLRRDQILKRDKQIFITRLKTFKRLSLK